MNLAVNGPLSEKSQSTAREIFESLMWSGRKPFDSVTHADVMELVNEVRKPENGLRKVNFVDFEELYYEIYFRVFVITKEDGKEYASFFIGASDTCGQNPDVYPNTVEYPIALDKGNI